MTIVAKLRFVYESVVCNTMLYSIAILEYVWITYGDPQSAISCWTKALRSGSDPQFYVSDHMIQRYYIRVA